MTNEADPSPTSDGRRWVCAAMLPAMSGNPCDEDHPHPGIGCGYVDAVPVEPERAQFAGDFEPWCKAKGWSEGDDEDDPWLCERPPGHEGPHAVEDIDVQRWADDPVPSPESGQAERCDQFPERDCPSDGCEYGCANEPQVDLDGRSINEIGMLCPECGEPWQTCPHPLDHTPPAPSPVDGPGEMNTITPTDWTSTAYGDDTEWPWWDDEGNAVSWVAITYHWPAEPGETETVGCPRPGLAPEHWTWELLAPSFDVVLDGTAHADPAPALSVIVDLLHATALAAQEASR